ncbi:GNAT family N-acetyltransferase [Ectothiorhodospiraceae bacterium WFHF3C12]|nr:GNAT family N-acetyltransferase [Ectothiorhodospiraceae bacterium WFHF3C12]
MSGASVTSVDLADEGAVRACFPVMVALRTHLDEAEFVRRVRVQAEEGYRLACIAAEGGVTAVAGYRFAHFMAWGRVLYVDDLVTHPDHRRRGYSGLLLDWLIEHAREAGCEGLHLDSGYQRHDAHRLYLNKGLDLTAHHFNVSL